MHSAMGAADPVKEVIENIRQLRWSDWKSGRWCERMVHQHKTPCPHTHRTWIARSAVMATTRGRQAMPDCVPLSSPEVRSFFVVRDSLILVSDRVIQIKWVGSTLAVTRRWCHSILAGVLGFQHRIHNAQPHPPLTLRLHLSDAAPMGRARGICGHVMDLHTILFLYHRRRLCPRGGRPGPGLICNTPQPPPPPRVLKDGGVGAQRRQISSPMFS